jgi:hypothetical protein
VLPGLFQYCVGIGRQLGIPAMRCHRRITIPRDMSGFSYHISHPLYWLKGGIIAGWSRTAERRRVQMPDGRIYTPGYKTPSIVALEDLVEQIPWPRIHRAVEVVVHPANRIDKGLFGSLTESRVGEYEVLRDANLADRLRRKGIFPAGFEAVLISN